MTSSKDNRIRIFRTSLRAATESLALAIMLALAVAAMPAAQAQTLSVLHAFSGNGDGAVPAAGLTMDGAGNFYGTTSIGGAAYGTEGYGTVFKLSRAGAGWILRTIYTFQGGADGSNPYPGVVFGPDGALYGTTSDSGDPEDDRGIHHHDNPSEYGAGTVFRLTPPSRACVSFSCPWTKTVLYHFTGMGVMARIPVTAISPSMRRAISTAQPLTEEKEQTVNTTTAARFSSSPDPAKAGRKACSIASPTTGTRETFLRAVWSSTAPVMFTAQPF